jgi:gluconate 2-dehydrogenase alpha chain
MRTSENDYSLPNIRDELRYVVRHDLMQNTARDTITVRNNPQQESLPMRRLGSFLPGEVVGGSGVHWSGHTWRWTDMEFKVRSNYEERYGKKFIPDDMTIQDWGITYAELEPYYDKFEYTAAVSGKAGNLGGQIQAGGNPFEAPRAREYPLPPLTPILASEMFSAAARDPAIIRSRGRRRMRRSPTPIRTARNSAPASIAAIASASAAKPTPKAART